MHELTSPGLTSILSATSELCQELVQCRTALEGEKSENKVLQEETISLSDEIDKLNAAQLKHHEDAKLMKLGVEKIK